MLRTALGESTASLDSTTRSASRSCGVGGGAGLGAAAPVGSLAVVPVPHEALGQNTGSLEESRSPCGHKAQCLPL